MQEEPVVGETVLPEVKHDLATDAFRIANLQLAGRLLEDIPQWAHVAHDQAVQINEAHIKPADTVLASVITHEL